MKKILSLILATLLLVSMIPTAMAADTNPASEGTIVSVTGTKGATYEVTVPATLNPGQSGTVTATGTWAANQTLNVTCLTSVNLVNGSDTIPVSIKFDGIAEAGNDNGDVENATATVTVGDVDMSAYFGTWTGTLTYAVDLVTEEAVKEYEANTLVFKTDGNAYLYGDNQEVISTYTGWDTATYSAEEETPWYDDRQDIITVIIEDGVTPVSTAYWFSSYYGSMSCEDSLTKVVIGNGVTSIGDSAFFGCAGLTSITIPDNVTEIGHEAFRCCHSLTSVTIGDGVTNIETNAFENCSALENVKLGNSVTNIGSCAFFYCENLTNITIPDSVIRIEGGAFACTGLTSAIFENTSGWAVTSSADSTSGDSIDVTNPATNATNFLNTYNEHYWIQTNDTQIITFTIDGTEYQAEEGMTWEQWVESKYNTVGAVILPDVGDNYFAGIGDKMIGVDDDAAFYTDKIIANESYELFY